MVCNVRSGEREPYGDMLTDGHTDSSHNKYLKNS